MLGSHFLAKNAKFHLAFITLNLIEFVCLLNCDTYFDHSVRQASFCLGRCSTNSSQKGGLMRAATLREFDSICKQPKSINLIGHNSQFYYSGKSGFGQSNSVGYRVFVFDFYLVSGIVYIDFTQLSLTPQVHQAQPQPNVSLIIGLVAHQFITFRIFNLPSRKSIFISNVKIFLNGAASLDLMEKKEDLVIEVYHSPFYEYSPDRKEWINYMNNLFGTKKNGYVEYLSLFCHISHIRIDLNKMVFNLHNASYFEDFVEPLEKIQSLSENMDSEAEQYYLGKTCSFDLDESKYFNNFKLNQKMFAINLQPHIFLDIGMNSNLSESYLKIFIKQCDITKIYNLILFVNNQFEANFARTKKLIIDENYCHLKIYSNADISNLLGDKYDYVKFDYNLSEINMQNKSKAESTFDMREEIFNLIDKNELKKFVYMKVIPNATEIELRFLSINMGDDFSADKFYNTINQQIIIEKETENKNISSDLSNNYSIKFAILESIVKEYFHSKDIDLRAYLNYNRVKTEISDSYDIFDEKNEEIEYFWISNKKCRAIILDSEIFPGVYPYLLFFNSNLYLKESNCYYFDQNTNIFHMMLGFNFNHESYVKTVYFNLKQDIYENNEFNYLNIKLEAEREKAVKGYYNNILLKAIESNYRVATKSKLIEMKDNQNSYEIISTVKFKSLDDSISWRPEFCWLSQLDCYDTVDSFFFSNYREENDFFFYDEFDLSNYKMQLVSNKIRRQRSPNYEFGIQTALVDHTLLNFSTQIQKFKFKKYFLHEIKMHLRFDKISRNFKNVLCNLRPFASCNKSLNLDANYSNQKTQLKETCEETGFKQFFDQNSIDKKTKTVLLTKFDSKGYLIESVDYDSNNKKLTKIPCSKLIPTNAFNVPDSTTNSFSPESASGASNSNEFYQSIIMFLNLNKLTIILVFFSIVASFFLVMIIRLIYKKSNRANSSELYSQLSKRNMELKPLNPSAVDFINGEKEPNKKSLKVDKNGRFLNKKLNLIEMNRWNQRKTISEV